jgi:hypothetical protein
MRDARPIPGRPGYWIDRDRKVWVAVTRNGRPGPWRVLIVVMRGRNRTTPCIRFANRDGGQQFANVNTLYRDAFLVPPPLPEGTPSGIPDDDDSAGDWPAPPTPASTIVAGDVADAWTLPPMLNDGWFAKGTGHWAARLDDLGVVEMRRLRSEGWSTGKLAARYGVSRNTVCYALNGTTWSHIGGSR